MPTPAELAAFLVTTVQFAEILGVSVMDLHNLGRSAISPAESLGRGRALGHFWAPWTVFATVIARRVRDRAGATCDPRPLHKYLLALGPDGFKEAILAGRHLILIVNGAVMPLLVSKKAITESGVVDPIVAAGCGAEVQVADLAEAWGQFAKLLEALRGDQAKAKRKRKAKLAVPFHSVFTNN